MNEVAKFTKTAALRMEEIITNHKLPLTSESPKGERAKLLAEGQAIFFSAEMFYSILQMTILMVQQSI